jgi:mRNA-degrading endonuclease RelE of RelBE toxin-antitoxin system
MIRREVIERGELDLVPEAKLRQVFRPLERDPTCGKPLVRELAGCRSLRVAGAEDRLVYRSFEDGEVVEVLAIGRRREGEVHAVAEKRL